MVTKVVRGVFLLLIAALDVGAARDVAALERKPGAARLVRLVGPPRTRPFLLGVAAFLGLTVIILAIAGVES